MAKLITSNVTFLDYTDLRKLEVYISSNLPQTQIYNPNSTSYSPDWSNTYLELTAEVYLDYNKITPEKITWHEQIGGDTILCKDWNNKSKMQVSYNEMSGDVKSIIYTCEVTYQNKSAFSKIIFTRVDTGLNGSNGKDGTSVTILGSYDSLSDLQVAHPTGNAGDSYIIDGDLYVWAVDDSIWENVGHIEGPAGKDGQDAKSIILNANAQVFKVSNTGTITPKTISVISQEVNTSVTSWTYSTNGGQTFLSTAPNGVSRNGSIVTVTGSDITSNMIIIKASDGTYSDTYTIYKVSDGAIGESGQSASMAFLTNENIAFSADQQGQISTISVPTNIVAYSGTTKVTPTIGEILDLPEGMKIDTENIIEVNNELILTITVENNATLGSHLSNSGTINIPVTYPVNTVLILSWSKINTGATGADGADAVTFQVYSEDGYVLSSNTPSITLQTFAYSGDSPITAGATYQWYIKTEDEWVILTEEITVDETTTTAPITTSYAEIHHTSVSYSCSYMCKMTFNGLEYVDVVTIDDKNDTNIVFTSKPTSYAAGDIWVVGGDYVPSGTEIGTVLKAQHTNNEYADEDWVTATKYDDKISNLESDVNIYKQYISLDTTDGIKMHAVDQNGIASEFSTSLSNTQLSFNQADETVAYINNHKMYITEAEIESPLTVTGEYSGNTMLQAPTINLGDFSLVVESNGSLSVVSNL